MWMTEEHPAAAAARWPDSLCPINRHSNNTAVCVKEVSKIYLYSLCVERRVCMRETETDRVPCVFLCVRLSLSYKYRWHSLRLQGGGKHCSGLQVIPCPHCLYYKLFQSLSCYIRVWPLKKKRESFEKFYFKQALASKNSWVHPCLCAPVASLSDIW